MSTAERCDQQSIFNSYLECPGLGRCTLRVEHPEWVALVVVVGGGGEEEVVVVVCDAAIQCTLLIPSKTSTPIYFIPGPQQNILGRVH